MVSKALYVTLKAQSGKEQELARFLKDGLALAEEEPETLAWFAIQIDPATFAIFDAFANDAGREAHLKGRLAAALMHRAGELLAEAPHIARADALAAKMPHSGKMPAGGNKQETIPLQIGSELRIRNNGDIILGNPEIELAMQPRAADAVLAYTYDPAAGEHTLRLLDPVANRRHMQDHRPND